MKIATLRHLGEKCGQLQWILGGSIEGSDDTLL
jgi:hypothetical protein